MHPGQRIRALVFSTLYPSAARPTHGPFVETRLLKLLETGEVDARVVAPVPWFPWTGSSFGRYALMAKTPAEERRNGVHVLHPRYFLPPGVGMSAAPLLLALGAWPSVRRLLAQGFSFDLIDAHYIYPDGVAAALLAKWAGKPLVLTSRGSDINLLPRYKIPAAWIRWACRRAAACIAVSSALAEQMRTSRLYTGAIHVLRNGVDCQAFKPVETGQARAALGLTGGPVLLTVGNLVPLKRQAIAIDVLRELLPEHGGARLLLVGDGPERARLSEYATQAGVADKVTFVGSVAQDKLPLHYSAADVMLLPSEREGWPNVVLEAIACGTPVVAAKVGGVPEILARPGLGEVVDSADPGDFAAAVRRVLDRPGKRVELRDFALGMDWQPTSEGQLRLFRQTLAGGA